MTKITPGSDAVYMSTGTAASKAELLQKRKSTSPQEIDKAASGFESLLVHKMLQEMWSNSKEGIFGESSNEGNIFRDMFNQAMADEISKGEGMGVKKFVARELSKNLNVSPEKFSEKKKEENIA